MPDNNTFKQLLIRKAEKFVHFYLNPEETPNPKENFGFKSLAPAPHVDKLKDFESKSVSLNPQGNIEFFNPLQSLYYVLMSVVISCLKSPQVGRNFK